MTRSCAGIRRRVFVFAAAWWLVSSSASLANNDIWDTAASGLWGIGSNWLDNSVPGNGDQATFNLAESYTVTFDFDPPAIQALTLTNAAKVTFNSSSFLVPRTLSVNSASGSQDVLVDNGTNLTLGTFGGGIVPDRPLHLTAGDDLTVQNGATLNVRFGSDVITTDLNILGGQVNVNGSGSTLNANSSAFINTGSLNVTAGGLVQNPGAFVGYGGIGAAIVSGANSQWDNSGPLTVGEAGDGTLTIEAGGNVSSTDGVIANSAGLTGTATVAGAGSTWTNSGSLAVGNEGMGTLMIEAGGSVSSAFSEIGQGAGSTGSVTVDGTDSLWTLTNSLDVGDGGDGSLTIANGGTVSSLTGTIADADVSTGFVTVMGDGSTWTMNGESLFVGEDGVGMLSILDGGAVSNANGFIGLDIGSDGAAKVTGAGSTWTNSGSLTVGDFGLGKLVIKDGGSVSSMADVISAGGTLGAHSGSNGAAKVTGAGSAWTTNNSNLVVGDGGAGTLLIEAGGSVSNRAGTLGELAGSTGSATVTGAGSNWTNSSTLVIGSDGTGTLTIEAGGSVSSNWGFVGDFEHSIGTATVTGAGSTWTSGGFFAVGQFGTGTLTIEDGGDVSNTIGFIGTQLGSSGAVTVTGAGSTWANSGNFVVGFQGLAELSVLNGGSVASGNTWLAGATTSTATATVTGPASIWSINGRLAIGEAFDPEELGPGGGTGTLNIQPGGTVSVAQETALFPGGTLNLEGGTLDTASVSFQGGGAFHFLGGTLHVGTFNGNLTNQGGAVAPGHSAGSTTIVGDYAQQSGGAMEIEIGGMGMGSQYDFINVTGNALVDGDLELRLIDGFIPNPAQSFLVFNASSLLGAFDNAANGQRLTTSDGGGSFLVHYGAGSTLDPTQIVLSDFLAVELPGDYNQNGTVDEDDYTVWRDTLGQAGMDLAADGNGNDQIDAGDYDVWKLHFGDVSLGIGAGSGSADFGEFSREGASPSHAAVPEPSSLAMGLLALGAAAGFRGSPSRLTR